MAIDQRIQTTITAGRRSAHDMDQGPIMVILLGCLAVAMCFTTLGMGFVNIARSAAVAASAAKARQQGTVPARVIPVANPLADWKLQEQTLGNQILALQQQRQRLDGEEQDKKTAVESTLQSISVERRKSAQSKQELDGLDAQRKQLGVKFSELQSKFAGSSEEERRQLQLRAQLDQQLADTKRQIAQTVTRLQELRESIEDRKNSFSVELLRPRDAKRTVWVECTGSGLTLLPQGTHVTAAELNGSPRFLQAIEGRHIEFLIRPDGYHAFVAARNLAERQGAASYGYEPVDANWRLKYK